MRIAISGSHATGKSTLVDELARQLDGFVAMPELYYQLEDEGYAFADPPTLEAACPGERSLKPYTAASIECSTCAVRRS